MPAAGLRRRFLLIQKSRPDGPTPADLLRLAHDYAVSMEALTRRLEELRLLTTGTWDRLQGRGFRVREAQAVLQLSPHSIEQQSLPSRYVYLAAEAYDQDQISEGQLAHYLRTDRLTAREVVAELTNPPVLREGGDVETLSLPLGERLAGRDS